MHEEIFLQCLLWESGRAPGSKSHVLWGPLSRGPPGIFLSTLSLQQFVNYNSGFPILTVVSVTVSA